MKKHETPEPLDAGHNDGLCCDEPDGRARPPTPNAAGKTPAPAQLPVRRFHVVAGTLDVALEAYRQQSGVNVKVAIPADQLATFHTAGLQGLYTSEAALRELLKGTGLNCGFENADNATYRGSAHRHRGGHRTASGGRLDGKIHRGPAAHTADGGCDS